MSASSQSLVADASVAGRFPDFFIVGHAKCGTTALYEMLKRHPQIFMPDVKEPQFFARNPNSPIGEGVKVFEQTGRRRETLNDYLSLFDAARPEQRVGEASTFYLWSRIAPKAIAQVQPGARIIAILREPVSFVRSLHLQMLQNHTETEKDLRRALELEQPRRQGRSIPANAHWPEALMYSERVRYVEQLRRFHAVFPREQVLVLIYDDFRSDNEGTVRRVLRFLDVDGSVRVEPSSANPTVDVRSVRLYGLVRGLRRGSGPGARATRGSIKLLTTRRMRGRFLDPLRRRIVYREPAEPDSQLMGELRERFSSEVVALSDYLGRDLVSLWGYDSFR
jgi:Sulfotransferase domain